MSEFAEEFKKLRGKLGFSLEKMGESLGYSRGYLCDLEKGRRNPSVQFIGNLCDWMGRGPKGRLFWHTLGARSHGWEISPESAPLDEEILNAQRKLGLIQMDLSMKHYTRKDIHDVSDMIERMAREIKRLDYARTNRSKV